MSGERDPRFYRHPFEGVYPLFPDNAASVDVSITDATFAQSRTVYAGGAGTIVVTPAAGGSDITFTVPAGGLVPVRVSAVKNSGTSATLLVAIW